MFAIPHMDLTGTDWIAWRPGDRWSVPELPGLGGRTRHVLGHPATVRQTHPASDGRSPAYQAMSASHQRTIPWNVIPRTFPSLCSSPLVDVGSADVGSADDAAIPCWIPISIERLSSYNSKDRIVLVANRQTGKVRPHTS